MGMGLVQYAVMIAWVVTDLASPPGTGVRGFRVDRSNLFGPARLHEVRLSTELPPVRLFPGRLGEPAASLPGMLSAPTSAPTD